MNERHYGFVCTERYINPTPEQAAADWDAYEENMRNWFHFHPEDARVDPAWLPDDAYFRPETWGDWVMP